MNEVCDEERFSKIVAAALEQVRNGVHSGLFTAYGPQEKEWGVAHRVLLPQLGPLCELLYETRTGCVSDVLQRSGTCSTKCTTSHPNLS